MESGIRGRNGPVFYRSLIGCPIEIHTLDSPAEFTIHGFVAGLYPTHFDEVSQIVNKEERDDIELQANKLRMDSGELGLILLETQDVPLSTSTALSSEVRPARVVLLKSIARIQRRWSYLEHLHEEEDQEHGFAPDSQTVTHRAHKGGERELYPMTMNMDTGTVSADISWPQHNVGAQGRDFDQFLVMKEVHNHESNFSMLDYTTALDRARVTPAEEARAAQLAEQIERESKKKILESGEGLDEELLHSAVADTGWYAKNADHSGGKRPHGGTLGGDGLLRRNKIPGARAKASPSTSQRMRNPEVQDKYRQRERARDEFNSELGQRLTGTAEEQSLFAKHDAVARHCLNMFFSLGILNEHNHPKFIGTDERTLRAAKFKLFGQCSGGARYMSEARSRHSGQEGRMMTTNITPATMGKLKAAGVDMDMGVLRRYDHEIGSKHLECLRHSFIPSNCTM